jgi:3-deoxy-D-manno-octulosonic-acid transferase
MAIPLIEKLLMLKDHQIVITFFSPSGFVNFKYTNKMLFKTYLPLDSTETMKSMVRLIKPNHLLFVKYDLWLNLITICQKYKIPVSIFSAKFNEHQWYFKPYAKWAIKKLESMTNIFTVDEKSKLFLESKNFKNTKLCGDTRYDQVDTEINSSNLEIKKPCLIIGSSWKKEEVLVKNLIENKSEIQVIVAPHEINQKRLNEIESTFGKDCGFHSKIDVKMGIPKVLVIDQIGILADLYSISDIAFIGGGFTGKLHNTIEPIAKGNAIIFGPKYQKFPEAYHFIKEGFAFIAKDDFEFKSIVEKLIYNSELLNKIKEKAKQFVLDNQGATEIIFKKIIDEK